MPKISALTSLAQASVDTAADVLPIVDATAPATTKKVTVQAMVNAGLAAAAPQGGIFALTGALTVSGQSSFAAGTAAAPSVKVGAEQNGLYSSAANTLDVTLNGVRQAQFAYTASAVNYLTILGGATGGSVGFYASGSDTNISNYYGSKGTGFHNFATGAGLSQFYITHTASAVNCFSVTGSAAGGFSNILESIGTDSNIQNLYASKGTSGHVFRTGGSGGFTQFLIGNTTNAVNYAAVYGSATGVRPLLLMTGSDANIGVNFATKGTGDILFTGGGASYTLFQVAGAAAGTVDYIQVNSAVTGGQVYIGAAGSDSTIPLGLYAKSREMNFYTGGLGVDRQFVINHTVSAVNYWVVSGAATGGNLDWIATGSDPNIQARVFSKGNGKIVFGGEGVHQVRVVPVASAVNTLDLSGSATGNAVSISGAGSDSNIGLSVNTKGTGAMKVLLNSVEAARFSSASTLGSYWDFKYVSGINEMKLYTDGAAANLGFSSSGGGEISFYTNDILEKQVTIARTGSAVNWLILTGSATGNAVTISTGGSDTNRRIAVTAGGTEGVLLGNATNGSIVGIGSYSGAEKTIYILNTTAAPTSNPPGGGYLYCEGGALKYRGSAGTVTTIAAA